MFGFKSGIINMWVIFLAYKNYYNVLIYILIINDI